MARLVNVTDTMICFDPAETDADGNPPEGRLLTSVVSFVSCALLFLWLIGLIINHYRPGFLPKTIALENSPFELSLFSVSNYAVCLLSMGLWRMLNAQTCFLAYSTSLTISQCFLVFNHAVATNMHNESWGGRALWIFMEVFFVFYIHFASSTYALWEGSFLGLKWIVYDGLWAVAIFLVIRTVINRPEYRHDRSYWIRVAALVASCTASYVGWLAGVWFLSPAYGIFYSMWIGFLALVFFSYSILVDYVYIEGRKNYPDTKPKLM